MAGVADVPDDSLFLEFKEFVECLPVVVAYPTQVEVVYVVRPQPFELAANDPVQASRQFPDVCGGGEQDFVTSAYAAAAAQKHIIYKMRADNTVFIRT
jgi:hypothetical protein